MDHRTRITTRLEALAHLIERDEHLEERAALWQEMRQDMDQHPEELVRLLVERLLPENMDTVLLHCFFIFGRCDLLAEVWRLAPRGSLLRYEAEHYYSLAEG